MNELYQLTREEAKDCISAIEGATRQWPNGVHEDARLSRLYKNLLAFVDEAAPSPTKSQGGAK